MRNTRAALVLGLAATLSGCAESMAPAMDGSAEMVVTVQGDGSTEGASTSGSGSSYAISGGAEGQVEVRARVYAQTSTGAWVEMTRGTAEQTVDASGRAGARVLATTRVGGGTYGRVRVEFERVRANVVAGVQLGTGPLQGVVTVDLGSDGKVVVEREVAFRARAGAETELRVDLNADQWLARTDAATRTTAEAAFQSAVVVTAH